MNAQIGAPEDLRTRKKVRWTFGILAVLLLLALWAGGGLLLGALMPVWLAATLAYVLLPLVRRLEHGMSSAVAALVVLGVLAVTLVGFLAWVLPLALAQAQAIREGLPDFVENSQTWLRSGQGLAGALPFADGLAELIPQGAEQLGHALDGLESSLHALPSSIIAIASVALATPFFAFFFMKDRLRFKNTLLYALPSRWRPTALAIARGIQGVLGRFLRAQGVVALVSGALTTVGYLIVGTPYALLMGLLMTVFCMIPYIGPVLGALPAAVFALLATPQALLLTVLVVLVVQGVVGALIAPRVIDDGVGLHPVYMLLSLLLGSALWGIWGALLGIPLVLCLRVIVRELVASYLRARPPAPAA